MELEEQLHIMSNTTRSLEVYEQEVSRWSIMKETEIYGKSRKGRYEQRFEKIKK